MLALLFLTVCAVILGALLTYTNTSARATGALRVNRNNDYDAQLTMDAAIATVRTNNPTCTSSGNTVYTPPTTILNNTTRTLRVDCSRRRHWWWRDSATTCSWCARSRVRAPRAPTRSRS